LEDNLRVPSKFPIFAGLSVRGEEKNCEKLGSCPLHKLVQVEKKRKVSKRGLIKFSVFFHNGISILSNNKIQKVKRNDHLY
jgi:hypothetical protein